MSPYILLPTPYSLLPTPYSLLPTPYLPISLSPYLPISLSPYLPISLPVSFNEYISNNDINLILVKYLVTAADTVHIRSSLLFVELLEPADKSIAQIGMRN